MAKLEEILKTINRLEYGKVPQFIYKFSPINEYLFKNILNNQLWFSNPLSFNDPFDCQYGKTTGIAENQVQIINKRDEKYNNKKLILKANDYIKKIKVNCFCDLNKKSRELLLWSHYGDSHKGVCLKFDLDKFRRFCSDNNYDIIIHKVHYKSTFPSVPIYYSEHNKRLEALLDILYIKSSDWDYEQEVRIFYNKNKLTFNKAMIVEIKFGCQIDLDNKKDIIQLVKSCNYPNVTFKQAKKSKNRFALEFEEINV